MGDARDKPCYPCHEENIFTNADGFCRECKELMCQTCFQHHLKAKYCRKHVLVEVTDVERVLTSTIDLGKCEKHENESIRFYCRKHDETGCGDCMLFDGHNTCQSEYINDATVNFGKTEEFQNLIEKLETLKSSMTKHMKKNTWCNNEINDKLVGDVNAIRKRADSYLDKAQADSLSFARKIRSENDISVENLKQIYTEIEEYKQTLGTLQEVDQTLFMFSRFVKNELKRVEKTITEAKGSNKICFYEFIPDQQLSELIFASRGLGSFHKISRKDFMISKSRPVHVVGREGKDKNESNKHLPVIERKENFVVDRGNEYKDESNTDLTAAEQKENCVGDRDGYDKDEGNKDLTAAEQKENCDGYGDDNDKDEGNKDLTAAEQKENCDGERDGNDKDEGNKDLTAAEHTENCDGDRDGNDKDEGNKDLTAAERKENYDGDRDGNDKDEGNTD
ncbi:uncharacterized protein LOC132747316 [Ruditapes philippinarum]|uniref:uncharacterized protein LOC132747316 n=1 Tax=Ruditapes philippinarum TaxID=129788 RepID=UPI00295BB271|nr:uncharacterized protein LOC132747316 [Ruditapes philippinarum]